MLITTLGFSTIDIETFHFIRHKLDCWKQQQGYAIGDKDGD
jgi:hypothetical protein